MANQNDMVTITNGSQTRKVARSFFEAHCTKTWRIVEESNQDEVLGNLLKKEPESTEPEATEITGPDLEFEPKTKKKKS